MKIKLLQHPKENIYQTICLIIGIMVWASILYVAKAFIIILLIIVGFIFWLTEKYFLAVLFGNSVMVT
ncbi:MAG: hypothetical protein OEZ22_04155 [Spirochaetia bacterium]|nr:hypothetical protein [Spirochaetia bacterium]